MCLKLGSVTFVAGSLKVTRRRPLIGPLLVLAGSRLVPKRLFHCYATSTTWSGRTGGARSAASFCSCSCKYNSIIVYIVYATSFLQENANCGRPYTTFFFGRSSRMARRTTLKGVNRDWLRAKSITCTHEFPFDDLHPFLEFVLGGRVHVERPPRKHQPVMRQNG